MLAVKKLKKKYCSFNSTLWKLFMAPIQVRIPATFSPPRHDPTLKTVSLSGRLHFEREREGGREKWLHRARWRPFPLCKELSRLHYVSPSFFDMILSVSLTERGSFAKRPFFLWRSKNCQSRCVTPREKTLNWNGVRKWEQKSLWQTMA